ncbi:MAG: type II secretion system protein GspN [Thermodesulfovibrionales bacterium]|nr:type II secretion system protein GspN [Thermodesulfovibrionales bacterium]
MKYVKVTLFILALFFVLMFGFWHIAVTNDLIENLLSRTFKKSGYEITYVSLEKGFFYNLKIKDVEITKKAEDGQRHLITLNYTHLYPSFLSIVRLQPMVNLDARCGSGNVSGHFNIGHHSDDVLIKVNGLDIADLGLLKQYGIIGRGILDLDLRMQKGQGNWNLEIQDCKFDKWSLNDIPVPLDMFQIIRGVGKISKDVVEIKSFTLDGVGIQAVIKGMVSNTSNLTMEILANRDFQYLSVLDISLRRFKKTDGFFVIPLNLDAFTGDTKRQ